MADNFSRRQVFAAGAAGAVAILAADRALAQAGGHDQHAGHHGGPAPASGKHRELIRTAAACKEVGEICLAHCLVLLGKGDTSLKDCAGLVAASNAMCAALIRLAALDSPRLKELALACIGVCSDCEKECRKHEGHHAECKACAEACAACIKACKTVTGA